MTIASWRGWRERVAISALDGAASKLAEVQLAALVTEFPTHAHVCNWAIAYWEVSYVLMNAAQEQQALRTLAAVGGRNRHCRADAATMLASLAGETHIQLHRYDAARLDRLIELYELALGLEHRPSHRARPRFFQADVYWKLAELQTLKQKSKARWTAAAHAYARVIFRLGLTPDERSHMWVLLALAARNAER